MNHCYLEDAGLYRATLEAMMYGSPTNDAEKKGFNDSVLERKTSKVTDLVAKFDKNLVLDDTEMEVKNEDKEPVESEVPEALPAKPRSRIPSMEEFIQGILRSSSPIPKEETPEDKTEQCEELVETPILAYRPSKLGVDFDELDTKPIEPKSLKIQDEATKAYQSALKSKGKARIAQAKASSTPKTKATVIQESPDSAYGSPGSCGSSGSSGTSTPSGSLTPPQPHDSTHQDQDELDVYLKLARAQLHKTIEQYSTTWSPETLQIIAETAATRRLEALQKIQEPCSITQTMLQIYESCTSGHTNSEMDTIIVSIFHLLQERVDQPQISVLEEYVVMKYNRKWMQ